MGLPDDMALTGTHAPVEDTIDRQDDQNKKKHVDKRIDNVQLDICEGLMEEELNLRILRSL